LQSELIFPIKPTAAKIDQSRFPQCCDFAKRPVASGWRNGSSGILSTSLSKLPNFVIPMLKSRYEAQRLPLRQLDVFISEKSQFCLSAAENFRPDPKSVLQKVRVWVATSLIKKRPW